MFQPGTAEYRFSMIFPYNLYHSIKTGVPPQELLQALPALRRAQLAQQLPPALRAPLSLAAANGGGDEASDGDPYVVHGGAFGQLGWLDIISNLGGVEDVLGSQNLGSNMGNMRKTIRTGSCVKGWQGQTWFKSPGRQQSN